MSGRPRCRKSKGITTMAITQTPTANAKVALVTGASGGIGWAAAKALSRAGYRVIGTSRSAKPNEVRDNITMLRCDVTSDEDVTRTVAKVLADFGRIDVLVNNAGRSLIGGAE